MGWLDGIFKFTTTRTVEVVDVHGALLYYVFCLIVLAYLIVVQFIYSYGYASTEALSGFFTVDSTWAWGPGWEYYDGRLDAPDYEVYALSRVCNNVINFIEVPCCIHGNQNLFLSVEDNNYTETGLCYTQGSKSRDLFNDIEPILSTALGTEWPEGGFCPAHCAMDAGARELSEGTCKAIDYCTRADARTLVQQSGNEFFIAYMQKSVFRIGACYAEPVKYEPKAYTEVNRTTSIEREDLCNGHGFGKKACQALGCCDWDAAEDECVGGAPRYVPDIPLTRWGCECKKDWELDIEGEETFFCTDHCCNPDDDADGLWCYVVDEDCEGVNWGTCAYQPSDADAACLGEPNDEHSKGATNCNGTLSGDTCDYSCEDGYYLLGPVLCRNGTFVESEATSCEAYGGTCTAYLCDDSCETGNNGHCEDGGSESEHKGCPYGTDCTDCSWRSGYSHPTKWSQRCDYSYWGMEVSYNEGTYPADSDLVLVLGHAGYAAALYPETLFGLVNTDMPVKGEWVLEGYSEEEMKVLSCEGCPLGVFKKFDHDFDHEGDSKLDENGKIKRRLDNLPVSDIIRSNKGLAELFPSQSSNSSEGFEFQSAAALLHITYNNYGGFGELWYANEVHYEYRVRMIADVAASFTSRSGSDGASNVVHKSVIEEAIGLRLTIEVGGDVKAFSIASLFINVVAGAAVFGVAKILTEQFMAHRCDKIRRDRYNRLHSKHCLVDDGGAKKVEHDCWELVTCYAVRKMFGCYKPWKHHVPRSALPPQSSIPESKSADAGEGQGESYGFDKVEMVDMTHEVALDIVERLKTRNVEMSKSNEYGQ